MSGYRSDAEVARSNEHRKDGSLMRPEGELQ